MKTIIIKELSMTNFRGTKSKVINFNEKETTISGANGTGKTTVFNAFLWLLFGKDVQDRKDFNIQPTIEGEPDRHVDCVVESTMIIDGESLTLRRVLKPNWVKPRGSVEQIFKGNVTETYYNDVPVNVGEYQKRINDIINDSVFKMVTNPMFFAAMKWQDQREQLLQLAGTVSDQEIAKQKPEFAALLDSISGKSFADFKKELTARKRRLKDDLSNIQPRIDQTNKLMPEVEDFAAIEADIANYDAKIAKFDQEIADKATVNRNQYEKIHAVQAQINELQTSRNKIIFDTRESNRAAAYNKNAAVAELENKAKLIEKEITTLQHDVESAEYGLNVSNKKKALHEKEVEEMRQLWFKINDEEFTLDDSGVVCPLLKCSCTNPDVQARIQANQEAERTKFNQDKAQRLANITKNGKDLSALIIDIDKDIQFATNALQNAKNALISKSNELNEIKPQLESSHIVDVTKEIDAADIPECVEIDAKIAELEQQVKELEVANPGDTSVITAQKHFLTGKRDIAQKALSQRDVIEKMNNEIAELVKQGKELSQQIADLEREEFTIKEFSKARVDECERRINGLFTMVKFQLFDYNIDDANKENPIETCVPLVNGVPFQVANTAGQVNAGLDIINALCKFYDVSAPIFIDGRESVNTIISTNSQIINLVVSQDKSLLIK